ncbi:MAG TPA: Wzt carbohydrate-binding domain-containing protein [Bryobacteraceae bacterium]|nr:Wzt carbohydrate-binding domain-containing protein [Bryobacteraceae bacterium]
MSLAFRMVTSAPLRDFDAAAPDGVVIGVIGEDGSGKSRLLRLAAGIDTPETGSIERSGRARRLGPMDPLDLDPVPVLLVDQTFARHDALVGHRAALALDRLRRGGSTILLASHQEDLLLRLADEIWWLDHGSLAGRGDPAEMLAAYRKHIAQCERAWGETMDSPLAPRMRRGDGRAEVLQVETLGANGRPTIVWRSGEQATVRVVVRFHREVADPVVGMMIRTRIGLNVYGTNTELERVKLGPCRAGETSEIRFTFACDLCPGEYTLTAASHDPDGVWHDWLEDAVAFAVSDDRYTAGVANLRARVTASRPE